MKKVEVRFMGQMEKRYASDVRLVDGYAVFVDGREQQPWLRKREAERLAKKLREEAMRETND